MNTETHPDHERQIVRKVIPRRMAAELRPDLLEPRKIGGRRHDEAQELPTTHRRSILLEHSAVRASCESFHGLDDVTMSGVRDLRLVTHGQWAHRAGMPKYTYLRT